MRICNCNLHQCVLLPVVQAISDVKSRVERATQLIFSKITILGQFLPALGGNPWALTMGISVSLAAVNLLLADETPLKCGLLISISILGVALLYSSFQKYKLAIKNIQLLCETYKDFRQLRLSQDEENEDIDMAVRQQSQDENSQLR